MARDKAAELAENPPKSKLIDAKTKQPIVLPEAAALVAERQMQEGEFVGSFRVDEVAKNVTIATWPNGRKFCVSYA